MLRPFRLVLLLLLVWAGVVSAAGNQPINPVPGVPWGAGGPGQIRTWQLEELPGLFGRYFQQDWVVSGGLPSVSNTCITPVVALEAFTNSITADRVTAIGDNNPATGAALDFGPFAGGCTSGTTTCTLIASSQTANTIGPNFHRMGTSNFFVNCVDPAPATTPPSLSVTLATVTITNGSIVAVADRRILSPFAKTAPPPSVEGVLGWTVVSLHATSGNGTTSCWAGWDTAPAIDWTQSNHVYYFPAGCYTQAADIRVSGQRAHILGAGMVAVTINYTGTGTAWWFEAPTSPCASTGAQCTIGEVEFAGLFIIPTNTTANKTAIKIVNFSSGYIHDIWVSAWRGAGTSTAFLTYGRDNNVFERLILDADLPIHIRENPSWTEAGLDSTVFRGLLIFGNTATSNPCILADDHIDITSVTFDPEQAWNLCNGGFLWVNTTSTRSSQGGLVFRGARWEQSTDQNAWMIKIVHPIGVQNLTIDGAYGGTTGNGIWLEGIQGTASIRNTWWIGAFGNTNKAGVGLHVQASAGVRSASYVSGGTVTGSTAQTCTCSNFVAPGSGAPVCLGTTATLALTAANSLAAGIPLAITAAGTGCTAIPTACTLGTGTATSCVGTIQILADLAGNGVMQGLDILESYLDGDVTFNTASLDGCTGLPTATPGTHNCILGLKPLLSFNTAYGDMKRTSFWGTNAANPTDANAPSTTLMGQTFHFPAVGSVAPTVVPLSGHLVTGTEVAPAPWLNILDCPTGLSPCSGSFKMAVVRLTIVADDQSFLEHGILTIAPTTFSSFPLVITCIICSPHIAANLTTGKVAVYHGAAMPPTNFYGLFNQAGVGITWAATLEVVY